MWCISSGTDCSRCASPCRLQKSKWLCWPPKEMEGAQSSGSAYFLLQLQLYSWLSWVWPNFSTALESWWQKRPIEYRELSEATWDKEPLVIVRFMIAYAAVWLPAKSRHKRSKIRSCSDWSPQCMYECLLHSWIVHTISGAESQGM